MLRHVLHIRTLCISRRKIFRTIGLDKVRQREIRTMCSWNLERLDILPRKISHLYVTYKRI